MKTTRNYRMELTEKQWQIIQKLHPQHKKGRKPIDRRHSKDYERNPESSKAMIHIAMTNRMFNDFQYRKMDF